MFPAVHGGRVAYLIKDHPKTKDAGIREIQTIWEIAWLQRYRDIMGDSYTEPSDGNTEDKFSAVHPSNPRPSQNSMKHLPLCLPLVLHKSSSSICYSYVVGNS